VALEFAEAHNSVIVSPYYRFLPEATRVEILEDVDDFWKWLHSGKIKTLLGPQNLELDLDRVLGAGYSAGGLLSIYLTLSYSDQLLAGTSTCPLLAGMRQSCYLPPRAS
jgi:acetyl esterase/lipase